ncbi:hypothetical protein XIS1_1580008 [Xenorhabdus innexi]|uniref:Uncharacterized protein n=1 Tax=Xenorhabdus innexi TaxID=290109 RepID=A0A1N6MUV7_9GAMM|nr:hypothetical protein XIS1_1580008 [Xenorhabdus innexi]
MSVSYLNQNINSPLKTIINNTLFKIITMIKIVYFSSSKIFIC